MPEVAAELGIPSSVAPVRRIAPLAVVILALCIFLDSLRAAGGAWWILPAMLGIPVVTFAFELAAEEGHGLGVLLIGFTVEAGLAVLISFLLGPSVALTLVAVVGSLMCFVLVGLVLLPILLAGSAYARKKDLEAGDAMLAVSGAWLVVIQALLLVISPREVLLLPGLAIGLLAVAVSVARIRSRRIWCERAVRGTIDGIRVRLPSSLAELELPPIYGSPRADFVVVERLVVGQTAYRSALVGEPIATIQLPRDIRPDQLPASCTPLSP